MKILFLTSRTAGRLTASTAVLGENMKMLTKKIAILSALLLLPLLAVAAPSYINYQGRLVDTTGNPLTGAQSIVFKLYSVPSGGTALWTETQSVTPDNGIFSVSLGGVTQLPASTFLADTLYLGVTIGADAEMSPRTRLLSAPYALYSGNLGSSGSKAYISTDTVISASQLQLGNFASLPGGIGKGALAYDSTANRVNYWDGLVWSPLQSGGISPWSSSAGLVYLGTPGDNVGVGTVTPAYKLDVTGGIRATSSMTASAYYGDGSALGGVVHLAGDENVGGVKTFTSSFTVTDAAGIAAANLELGQNVAISLEPSAALGAGVSVSSNVYVVGFSSAAKYYGDGSALTGIVTTDKVLKAGDIMTGTLTMNAPTAFATGDQPAIVISTSVSVSGQVKVGNFASAPDATALGKGALYYNDAGGLNVSNGAAWSPLASGGPSPWADDGSGHIVQNVTSNIVRIDNTTSGSLTTLGGINAGNPGIGIIGTDGKIPAVTSTYFADLSAVILSSATDTYPLSIGGNAATATSAVSFTGALSGDVTGTQGATSIANGAVTTAKILNLNVTDAKIAGMSASKLTGAIPGSAVDFSTITLQFNAVFADTDALKAQLDTVAADTTTLASIKLSSGLNSANIFVGNASNQAAPVALSGDATLSSAGALTIGSDAITTGKILNSAVTDAKIAGMSASKLTGAIPGSAVDFSTITLQFNAVFADTDALKVQIDAVAVDTGTLNDGLAAKAGLSSVNTFISSQTITAALGLGVTYGIEAASVTLSGGITASSGTFTNTGDANYSIETSSGINIKAGPLVVAESTSTLAGNAIMVSFGGTPMMMQSGTGTLTAGTQSVTFAHAFRTGTTPVVVLTDTSTATPMRVSTPTEAGFTAEGSLTDTYNWIAIGVTP